MSEKRVWGTSEDGKLEYVSITKELLQACLEAMHKSFYIHENVSVAFGLASEPEAFPDLDVLFVKVAKDGVSIAAVDKATGEIAGAAFNKLFEASSSLDFFKNYAKSCQYKSTRGFAQWMYDNEAYFDVFEQTKTDSYMEIMFLGVIPEFRRKGIAKKLFEVSIELARMVKDGKNVKVSVDDSVLQLGNPPKAVFGMFTSVLTQKIAKSLGFIKGIEIDFKNFNYGEVNLGEKIGDVCPFMTCEYIKL